MWMWKHFGNVSATERKQRRRKVSEPSSLLKKLNSKTVSAPNRMRTERTDMRVRFEAASAKNAEAMTSNRDEKHLYVFVHGLGGSEDDLLALATELMTRDEDSGILRVSCNTARGSIDGVVAGGGGRVRAGGARRPVGHQPGTDARGQRGRDPRRGGRAQAAARVLHHLRGVSSAVGG